MKWHGRMKGSLGGYKRLYLLNWRCEAITEMLAACGANGTISRKDAEYYALMVEDSTNLQ